MSLIFLRLLTANNHNNKKVIPYLKTILTTLDDMDLLNNRRQDDTGNGYIPSWILNFAMLLIIHIKTETLLTKNNSR